MPVTCNSRKKSLQCLLFFSLPLLNTRISVRMQSQNVFSFFSQLVYLHLWQWTDRQRSGSLPVSDQQYESCCLQRKELKNRELWISDSGQLLVVEAQVSCLTEGEAAGCFALVFWWGDSYWETENLGRMFFSFSSPEKFMLLCLLTNAKQDEEIG